MRTVVALGIGVLCCVAVVGAAPGLAGVASTDACTGPVERPAAAETVVVTRGLQVVGDQYEKRSALVAGYDGEARPTWSHDLGARGRFVGHTVDVTDAGTLVVSREGDHSVVELLDGEQRPVRAHRFGLGDGPRGDVDARDALLEPAGLVVADRERLVRYDAATERIVETWPLPSDAFVDGASHVTGVAPAPDGYVITVAGNDTGSILAVDDGGVRWRVGGLEEPYSPQYLGETVLFAEMDADRVVEVDRTGETVWALSGLDRPRSAERLPRGTTLVADRRDHRVIEVGSSGRVVWTAFVPWEPVDATRRVDGDRPSATALNASGVQVVDGANATYDELLACESGLLAMETNRSNRLAAVSDERIGTPALALVTILAAGIALFVVRRRQIDR